MSTSEKGYKKNWNMVVVVVCNFDWGFPWELWFCWPQKEKKGQKFKKKIDENKQKTWKPHYWSGFLTKKEKYKR